MIEITIPIYNEEKTLKKNIQTVLQFIKNNVCKNFIVFVILADNGSTDKTKEIGRDLAKNHKNVKYIRINKKGVGLALKTSWQNSKAELVGYMDLDLATDLKHLNTVFDMILNEKIDIINGSRLHKNSVVKNRSFFRYFVSVIFNFILRLIFKIKFKDGMVGFKFLKPKILPSLINNGAISDGWFFATEILIVGQELGYKIKELPLKWTDTDESKVKVIKLTIEYLKAMFKLKTKLIKRSINHDSA